MKKEVINIIIDEINAYKKETDLTEEELLTILKNPKIKKYFTSEFSCDYIIPSVLDDYKINDDFYKLVLLYLKQKEIKIEEEIEDSIKEDIDNTNYDQLPYEDNVRDEDAYSLFIKDISRYRLLTSDEVSELFTRLSNGDESVREAIVNSNLRLVISIARKFIGRGVLTLDLIQEGNVGLLKAIEKFDVTKGYKFSTYATWWIRQSILKAIQEQSRTIRVPVYKSEQIKLLDKVKSRFLIENNREATKDELMKLTHFTEEEIFELSNLPDSISLDELVGERINYEDNTLMQFAKSEINIEDEVIKKQLKIEINKIVDTLDEREKAIIKMRYGLDGTNPMLLEEVGSILGVSKQRIGQIEKKTLSKLKVRGSGARGKLKDFLR